MEQGTLVAARYRVEGLIGRGGMADVWEAHDERLQRTVAVKVLRPEMAARPDIRARFESEARSAARLAHPNVVAVYDTGEQDGRPFIVMERVSGETLADRIAAGPVDEPWLRRVAGDVLGALAAAHAAGVLHRDVKPGNILIDDKGCAKVADFGIAKVLEDTNADHTATNLVIGTPAYLAPERLNGHPSTPQGDLYALGVVLYEALTGRKPYDGPTPIAVAKAIYDGEHEPVHVLRPDASPAMVTTIEQALDRDPSRRFADAGAMAASLGVAAAGTLVDADDTAVLTSPLAAPATAVSGAAGLAPVAAGRGPLGALGRWWNSAPTPSSANRRVLYGAAAALLLLVLLAAALVSGDDTTSSDDDGEPSSTTSARVVVTQPRPTTTVPAAVTEPPHEDKDEDEEKGKGNGNGKDKNDGGGRIELEIPPDGDGGD